MRMRPGRKRLPTRRPPTLGQSVGRMIDAAGGGPAVGRALALCTRVGRAGVVPPGYRLADCRECGEPCWLNPDLDDRCRARGVEVVVMCLACTSGGEMD